MFLCFIHDFIHKILIDYHFLGLLLKLMMESPDDYDKQKSKIANLYRIVYVLFHFDYYILSVSRN